MTRSLHTPPDPAAGSAKPLAEHVREPQPLDLSRETLKAVQALLAERANAERKFERTQETSSKTADEEYQKARQALLDRFASLDQEAAQADAQRRRGVIDQAIAGEAAAKDEFAQASRKIASDFDSMREHAARAYAKGKAAAAAAREAAEKAAAKEHAQATRPIKGHAEIAEAVRVRLDAVAAANQKFGLDPNPPAPSRETYSRFVSPVDELFDRLAKLEPPLVLLEKLIIPKSLQGAREAWIFVVIPLAALGLAAWMGGDATVLAGAGVTGLALAGLARVWLVKLSRQQLEILYKPLRQNLADADGLTAYCRSQVNLQRDEALQKAKLQHEADQKQAKQAHAKMIADGEATRDERLRAINSAYADRVTDVETSRARLMREAVDSHDRRAAELQAKSSASLAKLEENYKSLKEQFRERGEAAWKALADRWSDGMSSAVAVLEQVRQELDAHGPDWNGDQWLGRATPVRVPPAIRLGVVPVDLNALPGGLPDDPRLRAGAPEVLEFIAASAFPSRANLLIEAPAEGRAAALAALQASMFRLLTSLPPGQVRFTIVDPLGIGRGFGAFMHLADHDPALVNQQVWTDPRQIEERLAELAVHMEVVTQKYLRNEYATIEEYNAVADEVAEPYRVLVIADFPAGFDEKSAARLAAIAAGGVPCGVLTLVAIDPTRPMPTGLHIDDLRPYCERLTWVGHALKWDDPDYGPFPLRLDPPPAVDLANKEIQRIGAAAKDAKRVEVPFSFIAPPEGEWWTKDSRAGVDVPLGKAGATRRQHLALGQGTSQHVLIAGRTGSGKSTLMHAMIVNLALNYSPDEIDLYLIDFKKGVEFKIYATHALPHASVVAIESEREFGLSVLQRLDAEMRARGDRFRDAGVQDVNGYRNVPGAPPLPRVLLIVDEFQEFFVEEDKLAQEAALLLDRLVRQGRAFGVHVHLGSQSLGGAFTLARSTLGQMAVRIALQCSETDSHLILSEQNPAARMLARPGEAIYNDANGAPEGNHFFQVVWLADEKRETYLRQLKQLAQERRPALARTPIVFEGDAPADLAANPLLKRMIEAPARPEAPRSAMAWVGDAIAIKDPTSALFRRQGGNHLLIVGQNDASALGVMASVLISLAVQFAPAGSDEARAGARFLVLDGTPEDHPETGTLARVAASLPHRAEVGTWRDATRVLADLSADLQNRQAGADGPEVFLLIQDLPRFRDLRRREDDFGFGSPKEDAGPADHLDAILKEGPGHGVHLVTWCDTSSNLNRHFTNQQLREFEMRVLFQMSPTDSGHLLDSAAASKLGPHRALFASEDQNRLEKFRPYGIPSSAWLEALRGKLAARTAEG